MGGGATAPLLISFEQCYFLEMKSISLKNMCLKANYAFPLSLKKLRLFFHILSSLRPWDLQGDHWPVIHGCVFLAPCKTWFVQHTHCTVAFTIASLLTRYQKITACLSVRVVYNPCHVPSCQYKLFLLLSLLLIFSFLHRKTSIFFINVLKNKKPILIRPSKNFVFCNNINFKYIQRYAIIVL